MKKSFKQFLIDVNEIGAFTSMNSIDQAIMFGMYTDYYGTTKDILYFLNNELVETKRKSKKKNCILTNACGDKKRFNTLNDLYNYIKEYLGYKFSYCYLNSTLNEKGFLVSDEYTIKLI